MRQFIVDAFTDRPFRGNPAAVCVMDAWPTDSFMASMARENNLSETAFAVREGDGYRLRWFTPGAEVEPCGHATLATAYVILNHYDRDSPEVVFSTLSGRLAVSRTGDEYRMDFPVYPSREVSVTDAMQEAFGVRPTSAHLGVDLVCVFEGADTVAGLSPDQGLLAKLPGRIKNATARGTNADCVSRSFCPKLSVPEDPVCGSAHCQIAPHWAGILGKREILAYQASARGGYLRCALCGDDRIAISGKAALVAITEIVASPGNTALSSNAWQH